jgi:hypothetical protein
MRASSLRLLRTTCASLLGLAMAAPAQSLPAPELAAGAERPSRRGQETGTRTVVGVEVMDMEQILGGLHQVVNGRDLGLR